MSAFGNWGTGLVEWQTGNVAYLSIVFSWQLQQAYQRAIWLGSQGFRVLAGGPAVAYQPDYLVGVAEVGGNIAALVCHNQDATFTSRGCPRRCTFCIVPAIEGDLVELDNWEAKPIVCDNNLLACSRAHFDRVIDRLKPLKKVDFNQGLDARLLTPMHAQRLVELDLHCVRLAWDFVGMESLFMRAVETLKAAGLPASKIRAYVLIGYKDTPEDALYRLEAIRKLGLLPNPMRFQPLDSVRKNAYVGPGWTHRELDRYMVYWSQLRKLGKIPFSEFRRGFKQDTQDPSQFALGWGDPDRTNTIPRHAGLGGLGSQRLALSPPRLNRRDNMATKPKFVTEEHLTYLDVLRESGKTNMFGAVPYIESKFPGLAHDEAVEMLMYWMRTFATRQAANDRC